MKAQKIQLSVGMNKYAPLEIVTHTGNKGVIGSILSDGQIAMAIGFVYSKTHGKIPVAWNMYGESTDRVSSKGIGNTPPLKDLCIAEIITEIPVQQNESDLFKQALNEAEKANSAESKNENKGNIPVATVPQEVQECMSQLKGLFGDRVEIKSFAIDTDGNLTSLDKADNDIVH